MADHNATFYSFKTSGKWYATGRGVLTELVFKVHSTAERRERIVVDNGDLYPGLSSAGEEFVFVVVPDEPVPHGYPLMLRPTTED